ncbi:uncharacterized protein PRCAT00001917001 [Priceomyces carsonii]|uniref:uncharacterized protein n=1 Tax=Priceomyces carsonii TaxID=28549 RepID=UPI002EDA5CC5|nr:unnamed protein product [Priceomyces carsonii]
MKRDIISLDSITVNNLGVFKKINEVTLPTSYPDQWYKEALKSDQISILAYYTELPVGALKAKPVNTSHKPTSFEEARRQQLEPKMLPNAVYVESLAVLEAYRNLGIGQKLLSYVIEETKKKYIHEIIVHVHIKNVEAIDWYIKKGFKKSELVVEGYYAKQGLEYPDAFVLYKKV